MRVLVASNAPTLASIVQSAGHEVLDARPGDVRPWQAAEDVPDCDVLVLELADMDEIRRLVDLIAAGRPDIGVVLVTPDDTEVTLDPGPARVVLSVPWSSDGLLAALDAASPDARSRPDESARPAAPSPMPGKAHEHVLALLATDRELLPLRSVATTVAHLAADRVGADAVALLLPDGSAWRVAGGVGLRPVESRMALPPEHWLVSEMLHRVRGAVIEHSDVARSHLSNAPIASCDQVVVATEPTEQVILLAGRTSPAFTRRDVEALLSVLREAAPSLREALDLRNLARRLGEHRDVP